MNTRIPKIVTVSFLALTGAVSFGNLARADVTAAKASSTIESAIPAMDPASTAPEKKAPAPAKSALVRNIELIEKKGGVIVRVHLSEKTEFTHQIEPAKDGKPYRIILDCQNAIHNLGANRFMTLPGTVIQSIRTSQYAVRPSRVCRVVLDLKKEAFYKVQAADKYIDLFVTDASVKPFDSWSTASFLADKRTKRLAAKQAETKNSAKLVSTEVKEHKGDAKETSATGAVKSKKPVTVASKGDVKKTETPATVVPQKDAGKKAVSATNTSKSQTAEKAVKTASKKNVTVAKSSPKVESTTKKTAKKSVKSGVSRAITPPVVANLSKNDLAGKKSSAKKNSGKTVSKKSKSSVADKAKSGQKAKVARGSSSLFASSAQAAIKPNSVAKANRDKGYSAKFRRSVDRRAIKLKGTQVAEFPKRLTIKYKSRGTRDPFASLFDKKNSKNKNMLDPRPNVESLTMVGVSRDIDGKTRGLFEDIDGRGYILSKGDRVEHGTVIKITSKKAYFQIFEYGWSRTVSLSLEG